MKKEREKLFKWSVLGFIWIIVVGSLLHFVFEWSGKAPIVGLFVPVNESVWEHLKLGYGAVVLFMIFEYRFVKEEAPLYFLGKAIGVIALNLFIVIFFYTYTSFTGKSILFLDIGSFVVGALICQIVSYYISKNHGRRWLNILGILLIFAIGIMFMVFTFKIPRLPIFKDPIKGGYGI